MTHNIKLNFDTVLKFKVVSIQLPEAVSKIVFSPEKGRFVDIESTRGKGFVDVSSDDSSEWIVEINGERVYDQVTFDATEVSTPDGITTTLWEVYAFSSKDIDDDVEIENVATSDIPDAIVDMLL